VRIAITILLLAGWCFGQERLVIDEDFTDGQTTASITQGRGEFVASGWRVNSEYCQLKWDLGRFYTKGRVEFHVRGPLDQDPKRSLFSAWNEEAAVDGDRKTQSFYQLRVMDRGMMLRLSNRSGGRSFEGRTPPLEWEDKWYHIQGIWDTESGVSRMWRDGELLREGKFNAAFRGFRWVFIGKDNYQQFVSIPGLTYRDLKVWVDGPGADGPEPKYYFPPPGEDLVHQRRIAPKKIGLDPGVIAKLEPVAERWALWHNGRLVHVKGDFNAVSDVKSNRKTWHAAAVGAAILQGKIPSLNQPASYWNKELQGLHAKASWRHVITQTAGFDYPYGDYPAREPGEIWVYSDWNPVHLCNALARVYGRESYHEDYASVMKAAYFDAIGMQGWRTVIKRDQGFSQPDDGVRFVFDLEDMGRLGLLILASGNWDGRQLIPGWFVTSLERKQTQGIAVNYNGPNDGKVDLDPKQFPEAPYGFMTWTNRDGDLLPGANPFWSYAAGAGGHRIYWNRELGFVFTSAGEKDAPNERRAPQIIEESLAP
jgi:CubicO group peptidase (beta-lactamase class C family)